MRQLSRDPFARTTLFRKTAEAGSPRRSCARCGLRPGESWAPINAKLYQYGYERDDKPGVHWGAREFCSISCFRSFND